MADLLINQDDSMNCFVRRSSLECSDNLNQLLKIVRRLPGYSNDDHSRRKAEDNFITIVYEYKDWPNLLDRKLEKILEECIAIIRMPNTDQGLCHLIFRLIFNVVKIRGYKAVLPMLPHEDADLKLILKLLSDQDTMDAPAWTTAYTLLLWLSHVCMIPYDITLMDISGSKSVLECIVDAGKAYLRKSTRSQEAAAIMLAKFHSRWDVAKISMKDLIDWSCEEITRIRDDNMKEDIYLNGILRCLVYLFKFGYREDLIPHAQRVLMLTLQLDQYSGMYYVVLNNRVKLLRNLGLIFLPRHPSTWIYKRRMSNISYNLECILEPEKRPSNIFLQMEPLVRGIDGVPEEVKDILEHMYVALRIRDANVRWSTAKGISHLCSFLPYDFVNDIVLSSQCGLLSVFDRYEDYAGWHGGCFTLAEFARRGVLMPKRFGDILSIAEKAVFFEETDGGSCASTNVRDAACYVLWSLAHYYHPADLQRHVTMITNLLILVSLFDREVTVRRAASAAFQECIGRQGHFPHGVDILTRLDFHGVSNRETCYLKHSVFIAGFPEYPILLVEHLIECKVVCRDPQLRDLAAKALNQLTVFCPDYMRKTALPRILSFCGGADLSAKHGAIIAMSEVILRLNKPITLTEEEKEQIMQVTFEIQEKKNFRGMGGDVMLKACFLLIENSSKISIPFHEHPKGDELFQNWYKLLEESLKCHDNSVQEAACRALAAFLTTYQNSWGGENGENFLAKFLERAESGLKAGTVQAERNGFCMAIGALPVHLLQDQEMLQCLIGAGIHCTKGSPHTLKWAESRRLAVQMLASVSGKTIAVLPEQLVLDMGDAMLEIMNYRPADAMGDIGSVVREAGMTCFAELCDIITRPQRFQLEAEFFTKERVELFIGNVVRHAQERIDRTRKVAGNIFASLLHGREKELPHFPDVEEVRGVFTKERCAGIAWHRSEETFHWFCHLLDLPFYRRPLLLGLMVSVTATSDMTVRHVTEALQENLARMQRGPISTSLDVMIAFVDIYEHDDKYEQLVLPMMKFLDFLLTRTCIGEVLYGTDPDFFIQLLNLTKAKVHHSRDVFKNKAALAVYHALLQFPLTSRIMKQTLSTLMTILCHSLPVIRKMAATLLSESLLTHKDIVADKAVNEAVLILTHTLWEENLDDEVLQAIDNLCQILDVPTPRKASKV